MVTVDWLRDSILFGKEMPAEKYKPKMEDQKQSHSQNNKVMVKKNLFDSALFQICEESYPDKDKRDSISKTIQEYGGRMMSHLGKNHKFTKKMNLFILKEDGMNPNCWKQDQNEDDKVNNVQRNYIHFRYVQTCIKESTLYKWDDCLHLSPLP